MVVEITAAVPGAFEENFFVPELGDRLAVSGDHTFELLPKASRLPRGVAAEQAFVAMVCVGETNTRALGVAATMISSWVAEVNPVAAAAREIEPDLVSLK